MLEILLRENQGPTSWEEGITDKYGVLYSKDGKKLIHYNNHNLKNYVVREGTESIGYCAFKDLFEIESIKLPRSLKIIEGWAFENCSSLKFMDIPYGVTVINERVFKNCRKLRKIRLSAHGTSIGDMAFELCEDLDSIEFLNEPLSGEENRLVDDWEKGEMEGDFFRHELEGFHHLGERRGGSCCEEGTIKLPEGLVSLGRKVFNMCRNIHRIELPSTLREIKKDTFEGCYAHIESGSQYVKVENGLYVQDNCVIASRGVPTEVILPDYATSIKCEAFSDNHYLSTVVFSNNLLSIGESSFSNCVGLTSIELPKSLTQIEEWAFYGCRGLISVVIPDKVTKIMKGAFYGCTALTKVTIGKEVKEIGVGAFENCSALAELEYNATSCDCGGSRGWLNPTKVNIGENVTKIPHYLLSGCAILREIIIPEGVTFVGDWVFDCCRSLEKIFIHTPKPPYCASKYTFSGMNTKACTLYVPKGSRETYSKSFGWGRFRHIEEIE